MATPTQPNCRVRFEPSGLKTEVPRGATLLEAARLAGVYLTSVCGGDGTCGKCRVVVASGDVDAPPAAAAPGAGGGPETVLACQARVRGDVTVTVPADHALDAGCILVGVDTHRGPHAHVDHTFPFDPPASPADAACHYALAVDIGTTTLVAHLVDLEAAETVDAEAAYNSQMPFGDDYIRRIIHAEAGGGSFAGMQRLVVGDLNGLAATLAARQGIATGDIALVVAAGNTAMVHFLFGRDAGWIRRGLDRPDALAFPPCPAAEVGLAIHPRGLLHVLPAVGAYVGADIVAGILSTQLYDSTDLLLFIDIGTNGEVVLGSREWMVCASSSAGPAFEGAGIRHGMRAAPGAIERVTLGRDGRPEFHTIGREPPRGLCGTGLLDALATLFEMGLIDRAGRLARTGVLPVAEGPDGPELELVPAADGRGPIVITQADIANLIRSKAGVYAAIQVLMETTDARADRLAGVYVAGGFGHTLDVRKAVAVGMLPDVPPERVRFVGNTSIAGAKMAVLSRQALARAAEIAGRMTYVDLMNHPHYMDAFMQANFLPHTDLARFPGAARRPPAAGAQAPGGRP